jgi:hypothetical protein
MSIEMQTGVGDGGSERIYDYFATNFRCVVDPRGDIEFRARANPQAVLCHLTLSFRHPGCASPPV